MRFTALLILAVLVTSVGYVCESGNNTVNGPDTTDTTSDTANDTIIKTNVSDLCLAENEITGWVKNPDYAATCTALPKDELWNIINGGAGYYIDQGLVEFVFYYLMRDGTKTLELRIMDFGTEAAALAMFNMANAEVDDPLVIPTHPVGAIIDIEGGGTVHKSIAYFGNIYAELIFSGLADNTEAQTTVGLFLTVLKAK